MKKETKRNLIFIGWIVLLLYQPILKIIKNGFSVLNVLFFIFSVILIIALKKGIINNMYRSGKEKKREIKTQQYSDLKRFWLSWVPFAFRVTKNNKIFFCESGVNEKFRKKSKKEKFIFIRQIILEIVAMLVFIIMVLFFIAVGDNGSWNYKKWSEIEIQRQESRALFEQNVTQQAFNQLAGADSVISKTEFENFMDQSFLENSDIYSQFNN